MVKLAQRSKVRTDEDICEAVAKALCANGLPAVSEYTGGNIFCVWVPDDPALFHLSGRSVAGRFLPRTMRGHLVTSDTCPNP